MVTSQYPYRTRHPEHSEGSPEVGTVPSTEILHLFSASFPEFEQPSKMLNKYLQQMNELYLL